MQTYCHFTPDCGDEVRVSESPWVLDHFLPLPIAET